MKESRKGIASRTAAAAAAIALFFSGCTEIYAQDGEIPPYFHSAYTVSDPQGLGSGNELYSSLKISGTAMQEEQVFSVSDIERIFQAQLPEVSAEAEVYINGKKTVVKGIRLYEFLKLCGLPDAVPGSATAEFFTNEDKAGEPAHKVEVSRLKSSPDACILAFASDGGPLSTENGGPLMLCDGCCIQIPDICAVRICRADGDGDPYYGLHLRAPLDYMGEECVFTINYMDAAEEESSSGGVPFACRKYSMREIEALIQRYPEHVHGNYFGISGNEQSKNTYGLGGFSDYFEGLDMGWFLSEQAGMKNTEGRAVFYGRDNDRFAEIGDLSYFFADDFRDYYVEINDETLIRNVVPIIGVSKNGYPLLPLHDHDMEGNVDYNLFNRNASAAGFQTKIGMVKNVSGPFIAGLANLDSVYGGYRNETSGDCIRIDLYVNRSDYEEITSKEPVSADESPSSDKSLFRDVPESRWSCEAVSYVCSRGLFSGTGSGIFQPDVPMSRGMLVTVLYRLEGAPSIESLSSFDDVNPDAWYASAAAWAEENGIVRGISTAVFAPDAGITREQLAAVLYRYAGYKGFAAKEIIRADAFSDRSDISSYAAEPVSWAVGNGLISGTDCGMLLPKETATREQTAAILQRFHKVLSKQHLV